MKKNDPFHVFYYKKKRRGTHIEVAVEDFVRLVSTGGGVGHADGLRGVGSKAGTTQHRHTVKTSINASLHLIIPQKANIIYKVGISKSIFI